MPKIGFVDPAEDDISYKGKIIFVNKLEKAQALGRLIRYLRLYFRNPQSNRFVLDFRGDTKIFPNIFTMLAALVDFYENRGKHAIVHTHSYDQVARTRFWCPPEATRENLQSSIPFRDTVWLVRDDYQLNYYCDKVLDFVSRNRQFGKNALECLRVAVPEAIENALDHSGAGKAFCMLQTHTTTDWLSLAICDNGVGIYTTLKNAGYNYVTNLDAIVASIERGVSCRDKEKTGREGNGLFALAELARVNSGQLGLFSGDAGIIIAKTDIHGRPYEQIACLDDVQRTTLVDFQIDIRRDISMGSIFDMGKSIKDEEYRGTVPPAGFEIFRIKDSTCGFATRSAAREIRNQLIKKLNDPKFPGFILSFDGIPVCTPSFIDELASGLLRKLGSIDFSERLRFESVDHLTKQFMVQVTEGAKVYI